MGLRIKNLQKLPVTCSYSVQEALDRHLHAVGTFLDLSKVYDVINHNIILNKLHSYGVRGSSNMWFKSYLTNRTQFAEISQTEK